MHIDKFNWLYISDKNFFQEMKLINLVLKFRDCFRMQTYNTIMNIIINTLGII